MDRVAAPGVAYVFVSSPPGLLEGARVMDRRRTVDPLDSEGPILPSRRAAIDLAANALGHGPVAITGEPGVGKTWLARRIAAEQPEPTSWIHVDLSPDATPADLFGDIATRLELDPDEPAGKLRRAIAERLRERHADGITFGLRIDEAHLASPGLVEEVRILTNRFGLEDGFDAFLLIGRTGATARRDEDVWRSIESRLGGRIHLRPLDIDEWRSWHAHLGGESADRSALDLLRRDLGGNPSRLRRELVGRIAPTPPALDEPPAASAPLLGPAKPPLLQGEGLIEVGWDDDELTSEMEALPTSIDEPSDVTDHEAIHAWNTWANAQGRGAAEEFPVEVHDLTDEDEDPRAHFVPPNLRAEDGQEFAPYGQLFGRSRSTQDRDSGD